MKMNNIKIVSLLVLVCGFLMSSCNEHKKPKEINGETKTEVSVSEKSISDAYVYLLSRALVVRQEKIDFKDANLKYNEIKYNEAGKAEFVNPNLDVAYSEAWIYLTDSTYVMLEIPEIKNRYYTVQLIDGWGEVICNLNERTMRNHPNGKYAICLKKFTGNLAEGIKKVEVPNTKVKMLARVELQNTIDEAVRIQHKFKLTEVGSSLKKKRLNIPMFSNKNLPGVELFDYTSAFMSESDVSMEGNDTINNEILEVQKFILSLPENKRYVDSIIKKVTIPKFITYASHNAGLYKDDWLAALKVGNYFGNYWTRTSANFIGIWANSSSEVIYFVGSEDSKSNALGDGKSYKLHFSKENLPENNVNSFWSVILVDSPGYRVVDNDLKRYNFNNYSKLSYNNDGSLDLYISPKYTGDYPKSNWLPSPKEGNFNLTLRMYVPTEKVKEGNWFPGKIQQQ